MAEMVSLTRDDWETKIATKISFLVAWPLQGRCMHATTWRDRAHCSLRLDHRMLAAIQPRAGTQQAAFTKVAAAAACKSAGSRLAVVTLVDVMTLHVGGDSGEGYGSTGREYGWWSYGGCGGGFRYDWGR
ncbi:hypothetical protein Fot_21309 [Forsythia ovata]|uniref:Uncharacterized protein n=1 Tax=Forsythia ovata TaxID=205694 RepID=A0ABD1UWC5_9LAMI